MAGIPNFGWKLSEILILFLLQILFKNKYFYRNQKFLLIKNLIGSENKKYKNYKGDRFYNQKLQFSQFSNTFAPSSIVFTNLSFSSRTTSFFSFFCLFWHGIFIIISIF